MRYTLSCFVFALCIAALTAPTSAKENKQPLDAKRVVEIAAMLPAQPQGVGCTIADRQAWAKVAAAPNFCNVIKEAETLLGTPIPEMTDDLFLDFTRTGNRTRGQRVQGLHTRRVSVLALAECIENKGRFLPGLEEAIRVLCGEKTWVMPAHDKPLLNFNQKEINIDLRSSAIGWQLTTIRYWLGDKLSAPLRQLIGDKLEERIFTPFTNSVNTGKPRLWWLTGDNNWNAVCLAGVTGAALGAIDARERRAFFAAAAEQYVQYFLHGITQDGYCSEGMGYWNYGFGNYVRLAETLSQATGGKVDLFAGSHIQQIALFGRRMEILPGIYPAFADCSPHAQPGTELMAILSRHYGWGLTAIEKQGLGLAGVGGNDIVDLGLYGIPRTARALPPAKTEAEPLPLYTWFADAGVLICRPAPTAKHALGVALKGGHNAENHNHNDVGAYVVALGKSTPLLDPGGEVYTRRTFSSQRYVSNVLNSFGHPVPRVAGQLQVTGRQAAAKILRTDFTDAKDTVVMNITSAYAVKELKKLIRTFEFSRNGSGKLTVTDEVEFTSPQTFGTAVATFSPWKKMAANRLQIGQASDVVLVRITGTAASHIEATEIHEDLHGNEKLVRLGIDLDTPVTKATLTLVITPE